MTTTNTTQAQPDAQPVKACESFTPLINGGDYRGTICCRCGEKEGAHVQPVTAAHSPLPWFAPVGYGKNLIMTECGRRVALAVQDIGQTPAEYLANAALIVAAVNERPALLLTAKTMTAKVVKLRDKNDALKARVAELESHLERVTEELHLLVKDESDDAQVGIVGWNAMKQSVEDARAALKGASK